MKRFLLTALFMLATAFAIAQTKSYTDVLRVTINDQETTPQEATIEVEKAADGTYTLSLIRFILVDPAVTLPIGDIILHGITATEMDGVVSIAAKQTIYITASDDTPGYWLGPMLGEVPVDLKGKMTDSKLYCEIEIDMSATLQQTIDVIFGSEITSGIDAVEAVADDSVIYDLTGRRVDAVSASGIYIINGKKVLVK